MGYKEGRRIKETERNDDKKKSDNSEVGVKTWKRSEVDTRSDESISFILRTCQGSQRRSGPGMAVLIMLS